MNTEDGSWRFIYVSATGQLIGSVRYHSLQEMALMLKMPGAGQAFPGASGQPPNGQQAAAGQIRATNPGQPGGRRDRDNRAPVRRAEYPGYRWDGREARQQGSGQGAAGAKDLRRRRALLRRPSRSGQVGRGVRSSTFGSGPRSDGSHCKPLKDLSLGAADWSRQQDQTFLAHRLSGWQDLFRVGIYLQSASVAPFLANPAARPSRHRSARPRWSSWDGAPGLPLLTRPGGGANQPLGLPPVDKSP